MADRRRWRRGTLHRESQLIACDAEEHDLDRAVDWFDRLVVVDRRILADGDPETVLHSGAYASIREHTHTHGHVRGDK